MKAKEYYRKYSVWRDEVGERLATEQLIKLMVHNLDELRKVRHIDEKNPSGVMTLIKEFNSIWNAMRKLDPTFRRDGFKNFLINRVEGKVEPTEWIDREPYGLEDKKEG